MQKHRFLSGIRPAQGGIAVRVAAEAFDNRPVPAFEFLHAGIGVACEQRGGGKVHGEAFAVHEGQQRELAPFSVQVWKTGLPDGFLRQNQRHAVLGEGLRAVPVQVSGKLVQHDNFRQPL